MNNLFKIFLYIFFIFVLILTSIKIFEELHEREYTICEAVDNDTYKILKSPQYIISFHKYLSLNNIKNVCAIFISPDIIKNNERKIYKILKTSNLKIILLERMKLPDYGELPQYYRDLEILRGHKIPEDEWEKLGEKKILLRFRRAIIERNVSVIFVPRGYGYLLSKLKKLVKPYHFVNKLKERKFYENNFLERLLMLFIIFFIGYLTMEFFGTKNIVLIYIFLLGFYLIFSYFSLESRIKNFYILIFVTLLFFKWMDIIVKYNGINFFLLSFVNMMVGIIIYLIFLDKAYYLYLLRFRGIKLFFFLPLFINFIQVIIYLIYKKITIKRFMGIFIFFFLLLLFVIIIRSGNGKIIYSNLEGEIRNFFEIHLWVRPRFKEIFGHALLFYGMLKFKKNTGYIVLILFGMMGQLSIINTFLHFTHPLIVSILQTLYGIFLGVIIAYFFVLCNNIFLKVKQ